MRKILGLLLILSLCLPAMADQGDLARFEAVVQYLSDSSKSQPTMDTLLSAAGSVLPTQAVGGAIEPVVEQALERVDDGGELQKKVILAMLKTLDDPWARLYTPEQVAEVRDRLSGGRKGALGITVIKVDSPASYRVVGVSPSSPAEGKLQTGESIMAANGVKADQEGFYDEITGDAGKTVNLEVRSEAGAERRVQLHLSDFESKTAFVVDKKQGIIRIASFGKDTGEELRQAMAELNGRPAIIDLRFNGGGYVTAAVASSDLFLDPGDKIVTTVSPKETTVHEAHDPVSFRQPVCLLVNNRTASAAEIFTAAMRHHVGAYVVGDKTYGKGSVQRLVSLPGNWGLKYTTSLYQTPDGQFIDKIGIEPDADIDMEPYLTASSQDIQMAKALAWAREKTSVAVR